MDFSTNIVMSEDLHNFKNNWGNSVIFTRKLKCHHISYLYCDTGEKTLAVLNTDRHIFVNKIRNSILKYLHLEYVTEYVRIIVPW